jgi:hypothetical protein
LVDNKKGKSDLEWLNELVKIKEKYEDAKQENEKLTRELIKRKLRYTKNE